MATPTFTAKSGTVLTGAAPSNVAGFDARGDVIYANTASPVSNFNTAPSSVVSSQNTPSSLGLTADVISPDQKALDQANLVRANAYSLPSSPTMEDRAQALQMFQGQIDALNRVFAEQKSKEAQAGLGRLGVNAAVQARRGLLGSDFGSAATERQNVANQEAQNAIDARHQLAINELFAEVSQAAKDAAEARISAAKTGADAMVEYIKGKQSTAKNAVSQAVKNYLAAGNDGTQLTTDDAQAIADAYRAQGINFSVGDVVSAVKEVVASNEAANKKSAKEAADLAKTVAETANIGLPPSAQEYQFAVKNGYTGTYTQYQNEDANRKAIIAKAGTVSQEDKKTNAITKFAKAFVPGAFLPGGVPVIDSNGYITPTAWKAAIAEAPSEGITRAEFIKSFGSQAFPGNLAAYGITPVEQKLITGELPE